MKKVFISTVTTLLVTCFASQAHALLIDFEELQTRNNFYALGIENTYKGFQWSPMGSPMGWASASTSARVTGETTTPVSGTAYAWNWNGPQSLFIDFGQATDVESAWFTTLGPNYSSNASSIQMFGYDNDNNIVASSSVLSLTHSFQKLSANFSDVYKLEMRANANNRWFMIDDINLAKGQQNPTIPEPATMLLLGSGLIGAIGFRKKRS